MAGRDRGNMGCFEAIGCGAPGRREFPPGMNAGVTMLTYQSPELALTVSGQPPAGII